VAEDREELILGVDGSQAVQGMQQYLGAFRALAPGVQGAFRQAAGSLNPNMFVAKARQMAAEANRALAGINVPTPVGKGTLGALQRPAGLTPQSVRELQLSSTKATQALTGLTQTYKGLQRVQGLQQAKAVGTGQFVKETQALTGLTRAHKSLERVRKGAESRSVREARASARRTEALVLQGRGLTRSQIAEQMGTSVTAAKSLLQRAMRSPEREQVRQRQALVAQLRQFEAGRGQGGVGGGAGQLAPLTHAGGVSQFALPQGGLTRQSVGETRALAERQTRTYKGLQQAQLNLATSSKVLGEQSKSSRIAQGALPQIPASRSVGSGQALALMRKQEIQVREQAFVAQVRASRLATSASEPARQAAQAELLQRAQARFTPAQLQSGQTLAAVPSFKGGVTRSLEQIREQERQSRVWAEVQREQVRVGKQNVKYQQSELAANRKVVLTPKEGRAVARAYSVRARQLEEAFSQPVQRARNLYAQPGYRAVQEAGGVAAGAGGAAAGAGGAAAGTGGGGGFRAGFKTGWSGGGDQGRPWSEMMGQTARIALSYGAAYRALSALEQVIGKVTQATIAYDMALTNLEVVTGRTAEEDEGLASTLATTAVSMGYTNAVGVELGTKAMGLLGVTESSQAVQEHAATTAAEVSTRVARVSGAEPIAVQTQLLGALRAFGWGVDRLSELEDSITYISRQTGQSSTELISASADLATLAQTAGFDPQELMALVAQVSTTTGQNPSSTAGQFRQVLSRGSATVAPRAAEIFGIDTKGMNTADIFEAVSQQKDITDKQLEEFAGLFGKGGSATVATRMVKDAARINELAGGAGAAEGLGAEVAGKAMKALGNQLIVLGSDALAFGQALVDAGILDWLGLLLIATQNMVAAGNEVLGFFNMLPRPLRSVAIALGEIYLASKLIAGTAFASKIAGTAIGGKIAGTALGAGIGAKATMAAVATQELLGVGKGSNQIRNARLATMASGATALPGRVFGQGSMFRLSKEARAAAQGGTGVLNAAKGATGMTGTGMLLSAAAIAALATGIGKGISNVVEGRSKVSDLRSQISGAKNEEALRDVAGAARGVASSIEKAGMGGVSAGAVFELPERLITSLFEGGQAEEATKIADRAEAIANALAEAQAQLEDQNASRAFTDFSATGLEEAFADLEKRGYNASERLAMLNDALFTFSEAAAGAANAVAVIDPREVGAAAQQFSAKVQGRMQEFGPTMWRVRSDTGESERTGLFGTSSRLEDLASLAEEAMPDVTDQLTALLEQQLTKYAADGIITQEESDRIDKRLKDALPGMYGEELWGQLDAAGLAEDIELGLVGGLRDMFSTFGGEVTKANIGEVLRNMPTYGEQARTEGASRLGSVQQGTQAELDYLEKGRAGMLGVIRSMSAEGTDVSSFLRDLRDTDEAISAAERQQASDRVAAIQSLLAYEETLIPEDDVLGRLAAEADAVNQQIATVLAQGVGRPRGSSSNGAPTAVYTPEELKQLQDLSGQQNTITRQQRQAEVARLNAQQMSAYAPNDTTGKAEGAVVVAQRNFDEAAVDTAAQAEAQIALDEAKHNYFVLQVQTGNSAASAAVDSRDTVGKARVAMNNAYNMLATTKVDSDEYNQALGAWLDSQVQYAESQTALANAQAGAAVDPRDSVGQARVALDNARRTLGDQKRETPGYADAQKEVWSSQIALAQAYTELANAQDSAGIAGLSSGLLQARVALGNARRTLGDQKGDTQGYYDALGNLRQAQMELADQERQQADRQRRLSSDLTNPVEQAALDVQKAMDNLRAAQSRGDGADVVDQAKLDLRNAQAQQEASAFQQRISDVQTAEDLGRISHSAYISYLQSEHDRLAAIAGKTRQQTEQLDEVDKLLKSAAEEMQGQFNIGDIELPTIYEVRRAVKAGAATSVADYSHSGNTVNINGASFEQVIEYLRTYLGAGAQVVTATTGRKI